MVNSQRKVSHKVEQELPKLQILLLYAEDNMTRRHIHTHTKSTRINTCFPGPRP